MNTRRTARLALVAGVALAAGIALTSPPAAVDAQGTDCVSVRAEARFAAASYNHWVHLENHCDGPRRCDVSTDVNPEPTRVSLAVGQSEDLLTFRGSPAREFTPFVRCVAP